MKGPRDFSATIIVAFAVFMLAASTAHAQFQFWPHYRSWWGNAPPFRHKHSHRHTKSELANKDTAKGPLQIIVSIADQRVSLYDNGALVARSSVSTGIPRHPTPLGVFSVIGKHRWHRSNLYSAAPMPYMQRITWSGIALHAGVVPGHPASHGCIRLTNRFAARLWHLTRRGTRVIIVHDDVEPVEISNPHLFQPKAASGTPDSPAVVAPGGSIDAAAAPGPLMSNADPQEAADLKASVPAPAAAAPQKAVPISVFVSRELSKLFVRRGFRPLFDVPVKIQNPEEPLGTHVFTAMEFQNEGAAMRWNVVSMPDTLRGMSEGSGRQGEAPAKQITGAARPVQSPHRANLALDRIEIPRDAADRISELLKPASSLIISDHGMSHETGKNTDFIVLTH